MTEFTDEQMRAALLTAREYTVVLLHAGPRYADAEAKPIVWEHARRNFEHRAAGIVDIVCPVTDDSPLCGVGIYPGTVDEVRALCEGDPGVQAGVFTYSVHPCRSFPGDALAG